MFADPEQVIIGSMERVIKEERVHERDSNALGATEDAATTVLKSDATSNDNKEPAGYPSQADLIRKKLLEGGTPEATSKTAWHSFRYLTEFGFSDGKYSEDWKLWKTESRVWNYYCRFPFLRKPGILRLIS